ncbi:hypothetical protein JAAARDRAFT_48737 [Jaapia argillacea MUCL 33604]|uniref:Protein kinase domain-containing protein n=1 Tax=Jaapia argillacea MUCL 33604 TaxID=933084 RepID=A0A067PVP8_9AGAM|nr:hypothetical protein JAAARDRAFT_48737 [Jaapia argillacea MUCL 33604]
MFREAQTYVYGPDVPSERIHNSGTRNPREQAYIIPNEHLLRSGYEDYGNSPRSRSYYGMYNGIPVVVKAWWEGSIGPHRPQNFTNTLLDHLDRWKELHHPNIAPFLGLTWHWDSIPSLVLPRYEMNINKYVASNAVDPIPLFRDVARGLSYLHSLSTPLPHGCITGGNILINKSGRASLTDIGLVKVTGLTLKDSRGTSDIWRWFAPEIGSDTEPYTPASDVYCFGMTMLEVYTGYPPFHPVKAFQVSQDVRRGIRPRRPRRGIPNDVWRIICECWKQDPLHRPGIGWVLTELEACIRRRKDRTVVN